MKMHIGETCFCCGKVFHETDDIVVCPECGTPYHRECWKQNGKCIHYSLHETGQSWVPARKESEKIAPVCPNCGEKNELDAVKCSRCGVPLGTHLSIPTWEKEAKKKREQEEQEQSQEKRESIWERMKETAEQMDSSPYCGLDEDTTLGGERLGDVADFVKQNTLYYMPKFCRFQAGHRISLNFPCLFFPQFYFANRKMWGLAIVLVAFLSILHIPQMLMALLESLPSMQEMLQENNDMMMIMEPVFQNMLTKLENWQTVLYNASVICSYLSICLEIVFALLGNWIYYRFVLRKVHKISGEKLSPEMRRRRLQAEGGTNGWLILGVIALQYILIAILSAVLLLILML